MNLNLKEKVVLVTGSTRGLGLGIVRVFLKEEAYLVVTGKHESTLNNAIMDLKENFPRARIEAFAGDLTKQEDIRACIDFTLQKFNRMDILIANIGSGRGTLDWNISENEWDIMIDLNFSGARRIVNQAIPIMLKQNYGSIVFISSIAGEEVIGAPIHYSVAKASLIAFSKNLAIKVARNNIRINTVCPGNIYFEGGTWDIKMKENKSKTLEIIDINVPQNRFATPEEIANLVVFISSEKSSFLTGACITIDGGQTKAI